jgi:glycosyltransferase involved in cell wall biosynthesis
MDEGSSLLRRIAPKATWLADPEALPLVSVIVAVYNYGRFLTACLKSVAGQTYANIECIVVDDHSTDNTSEVANGMAAAFDDNRRYSVLRNKTNAGQMASQSTGLTHCKGAFVVFLDADDILAPTFIERHLFAHLNSEYSAGLSVSDQVTIDGNGMLHSGSRLDRVALGEITTARHIEIAGGEFTPSLEAVFLPWDDAATHHSHSWYWQTQSAMMFRRSLLELILPSPTECGAFRICSDFYLARFGHLVANSMILFETLGGYRQHSTNNFAGATFIAAGLQGGDVRRLPSYESYKALVRSTIEQRRAQFELAVGTDRLSRLEGVLSKSGDQTPTSKGWSNRRFFRSHFSR